MQCSVPGAEPGREGHCGAMGGHEENGIGGYPVGGGTFWAELSLLGEGQPDPRVTEHSPEDSGEGKQARRSRCPGGWGGEMGGWAGEKLRTSLGSGAWGDLDVSPRC